MNTVSLSKCLDVHVVKRKPLLFNKTFQEDIILQQSSLHNRHYFCPFSGERRQARSKQGALDTYLPPSHVSGTPHSLLTCLSSPKKGEKIMPVTQAKEMIGPSLDYN